MFSPRYYQQEAVNVALTHMRSSKDPGVLELATGAGKSICIAMLSKIVRDAKKRVLVLQPSADLVEQNASKYRALGEQCSIFSASLNKRHTAYPVVFATPISVANSLERFSDEYALVIIDECDGVNDDEETTYQRIFAAIQPKRILGLTATPMRGKHKLVGDENTFKSIIYRMPHCELSKLGYVVPYRLGITEDHYETTEIKTYGGKFKQKDIDGATLGKERLTSSICADFVRIMEVRLRKCAFIFASSIKHAHEIHSHLPPSDSVIIIGSTKGRKHLLEDCRKGAFRYVITVNALSVGTDVPICDTIVWMRPSESVRLLQQMMGRGCRLFGQTDNWLDADYKGKMDCLVLDYAENLDRHGLDYDLTITDLVSQRMKEKDDEYFEIECPVCDTPNKHTAQRCMGIISGNRCDYRFVFKECHQCGSANSPSARHCRSCNAELIDPNANLTRRAARPPGQPFDVAVTSMSTRPHYKNGEKMLRVDYECDVGSISEYFKPESEHPYMRRRFHGWAAGAGVVGRLVDDIVGQPARQPKLITVKKEKGSKYYSVEGRRYE